MNYGPTGDALLAEQNYLRSVVAMALMEMSGAFIERAIEAEDDMSRAFWVGASRGARREARKMMGDPPGWVAR
jgi:hypothetical protein